MGNALERICKLQLLSSLLCPCDPREAFTAEEAGWGWGKEQWKIPPHMPNSLTRREQRTPGPRSFLRGLHWSSPWDTATSVVRQSCFQCWPQYWTLQYLWKCQEMVRTWQGAMVNAKLGSKQVPWQRRLSAQTNERCLGVQNCELRKQSWTWGLAVLVRISLWRFLG